jgi:hypothetical protein
MDGLVGGDPAGAPSPGCAVVKGCIVWSYADLISGLRKSAFGVFSVVLELPAKPRLRRVDGDGIGKVLTKEVGWGELGTGQETGQKEWQRNQNLFHRDKIV